MGDLTGAAAGVFADGAREDFNPVLSDGKGASFCFSLMVDEADAGSFC